MKITKFQNPAGKLAKVVGTAIEKQMAKALNGTVKKTPAILDDLVKQYGDVDLLPEQADALSDFTKYLLTKDDINLIYTPETKRFGWKDIPYEEAEVTWKHLPVMQIDPKAKFGFTEIPMPHKVPYQGGVLERVHHPVKTLFGPDESIVSPQITFSWQRTPFDSYEKSIIMPTNGWNGQYNHDLKVVHPGHLSTLGLVPSKQAKSMLSLDIPELDLSKMSREGMVETMRAVDDLVAPNATYLSGDFGDMLEGSALFDNIPLGAELMQKFDAGKLTADDVMRIINIGRAPSTNIFGNTNTKGLSTDSFKLIGDFGNKASNSLRWGGWQNQFNDLGTQNVVLLDAIKAFKAGDLSAQEYSDLVLNWMYKSFPSISSYNPESLVLTTKRYNWGKPLVFIRHPFALKGFKKGGKLPIYLKMFNYGKEITNI